MALSPLQQQILRHTARHFGATTIGALARQPFFAGKSRAAVKSAVRRLCGTSPRYRRPRRRYRYLCPEPLDERRVIYRLTTRATRLLGVSEYLARPLGLQARIRRYALIWFLCLEGDSQKAPFGPRDFPDQFPFSGRQAPRKNFYVEQTSEDETRIGFVVLDHGCDPRRVYRNAADSLRRFLHRGWLDGFISAGCFDLTVLTVSEGKRTELERGLDKHLQTVLAPQLGRFGHRTGRPLPWELRVLVVPGLAELIPDSRNE